MTRSAILTVRVTPEDKASLESLAKADRRPLSQYLELLLSDHLSAHGSQVAAGSASQEVRVSEGLRNRPVPVSSMEERRRDEAMASIIKRAVSASHQWERREASALHATGQVKSTREECIGGRGPGKSTATGLKLGGAKK